MARPAHIILQAMKQNIIHFVANLSLAFRAFAQNFFIPISYSSAPEAITELVIGLILIIAAIVISIRGLKEPEHERVWTNRRLQFTGVFGTILILLAFLRYEGIPYVSMQAVLWIVLIVALLGVAQLAFYRQIVLKPAQSQWRQRKTRDQYLPKPKARSAR